MDECMKMPGGGPHKLEGGQITGDSELALCLMNAIVESKGLNEDCIAKQYRNWMGSPPFDIGYTTRNSLGALTENPEAK